MNAKNNEPSHLCEPKNPTQNNDDVVENEQLRTMTILKYANDEYTYNDCDLHSDHLSILEMFGNVIGRLAGSFQYGHSIKKRIKYKIIIIRQIMDD